jgi:hypothetical protein
MKRVIFVLFVCALVNLVKGQTDPVNTVFEKYAGTEGFTTVTFTGDMLRMLQKLDPENKDLSELSGLEEVRILTQEDRSLNEDLDFHDEIYSKLNKELYKELMVVRDNDEKVTMLVREENGTINEFLLIVSGIDDNVLISIKGAISLSKLGELSEELDMNFHDKIAKAGQY